jgi:iron-sulfur cluster repair protein YtfE (RIC family)
MRIGTTPTHTFQIPINAEMVKSVEITYCQGGEIILQKYTEDCTIEGNTISTTLTQEDTFEFNDKINVEIQVRILDFTGAAMASNIMTVDVKKCLSKDVLA